MVTEETTIGEEATDEDVILPSRKIDVNIFVSSHDKISDLSHPDALSFKDFGRLACDQRTDELNVSTSLHTEIVKHGSVVFQNKGGPFQKIDGRGMNVSWFIKRLGNGTGKTVNRSWLLYTPVNQSAYCFCCLLFSHSASNTKSAFERETGFNKWKKSNKIVVHEESPSHHIAFRTWKETEHRLNKNKGIDDDEERLVMVECQPWQNVLDRILNCIKYLAEQNLALRGHEEGVNFSCEKNTGNFLELLKLLAKYDSVIDYHLKYAMLNPGSVSYLFPEIQNEFIYLLASAVKKRIVNSTKGNKYFGIIVGSTPDTAHREQLSDVIRFVDINFEEKKLSVEECFLGFIKLQGKDAASLETAIINQLEADGINFADCRSQCYDNASVMSGHSSGLQKRMSDRNPLALFINCDNHSLNLVGVNAVSAEAELVTFFGIFQSLFAFFRALQLDGKEM